MDDSTLGGDYDSIISDLPKVRSFFLDTRLEINLDKYEIFSSCNNSSNNNFIMPGIKIMNSRIIKGVSHFRFSGNTY